MEARALVVGPINARPWQIDGASTKAGGCNSPKRGTCEGIVPNETPLTVPSMSFDYSFVSFFFFMRIRSSLSNGLYTTPVNGTPATTSTAPA